MEHRVSLRGALLAGFIATMGTSVLAEETSAPVLRPVIEEESEEMKADFPTPERMEAVGRSPAMDEMGTAGK